MAQPKQNDALQPGVAKPVITPKVVSAKTHYVGNKTVLFAAKPVISNPTKPVTLVQKPTPVVVTTDGQVSR